MHQHYIKDVETISENRHAAHFPVWESVWKIPATQGPLGVLVTNSQLGIDSTHSFNGNRDQDQAPHTSTSGSLLPGCSGLSRWVPGEDCRLPRGTGQHFSDDEPQGRRTSGLRGALTSAGWRLPLLLSFLFPDGPLSHVSAFHFSKPSLWACDNLPGRVTYYITTHMPNPTSLKGPENSGQPRSKFLMVTYPGWPSTFETVSHCWVTRPCFTVLSSMPLPF